MSLYVCRYPNPESLRATWVEVCQVSHGGPEVQTGATARFLAEPLDSFRAFGHHRCARFPCWSCWSQHRLTRGPRWPLWRVCGHFPSQKTQLSA